MHELKHLFRCDSRAKELPGGWEITCNFCGGTGGGRKKSVTWGAFSRSALGLLAVVWGQECTRVRMHSRGQEGGRGGAGPAHSYGKQQALCRSWRTSAGFLNITLKMSIEAWLRTAIKIERRKNVTYLFNIAFIKVILNKLNTGCKVGRIELIGNIPSQGAEFAALLKNTRGKYRVRCLKCMQLTPSLVVTSKVSTIKAWYQNWWT